VVYELAEHRLFVCVAKSLDRQFLLLSICSDHWTTKQLCVLLQKSSKSEGQWGRTEHLAALRIVAKELEIRESERKAMTG
jgi:hypothetical protein